jgi:pimeloyl-ACP methyl ester carboxylesterase
VSDAAVVVENEFDDDLVDQATAAGRALPKVRRKWVNADVDGSHLSGVVWGRGRPEQVLLHGAGESARRFDHLGMAGQRPFVALDLPGHGQSSWRKDRRYQPRLIAKPVAVAIRSFAPGPQTLVGTGLGGLTGIEITARYPLQVNKLILSWPVVKHPANRRRFSTTRAWRRSSSRSAS